MNLSLSEEDLRAIASAVADEQERRNAVGAKLSPDRLAYPEKEAAAAMGVQQWTLRNARLDGKITARKLGRSYIYSRDALVRWLAEE